MKKKSVLFGKVLLAFLAFEAVSFFVPELWALFLSSKELEQETLLQLYQAGSSVIVIFAAFPVYVLVMRLFGPLAHFNFRERKEMSVKESGKYLLMAMIPVALLYGAAVLICRIQEVSITTMIGGLTRADIIRELLIGCFLMPLTEEIMFRGIALHMLEKGGRVFAVIVSTLFFALGHSNPVNVLLGLMTGWVFAWMTLKHEGIRCAYLCHVMVNLLGNLAIPLALQTVRCLNVP